jgi:redox-sensitive bicupin YhaK (pirin superfamily)
MKRSVEKFIHGFDGVDGAGVNLVRLLSKEHILELDPFLMLDIFDSDDYNDYIAGFPMHPHRGIETITYLLEGAIEHQDSLGNHGVILPGGTQWMTAGSGIMHQEMPQKSPRMMGFQLWLNMPAKNKMDSPAYREVNEDQIALFEEDKMSVKIISGEYRGVKGSIDPDYATPQIYFIDLEEGALFQKTLPRDATAFIYLFRGAVTIEGEEVRQKRGVLLTPGEELEILSKGGARLMYIEGEKLREPISWGGPIVMNTREELSLAFEELKNGQFLKTTEVKGTESLNPN